MRADTAPDPAEEPAGERTPAPRRERLPLLAGLAAWALACLLPLDGDGVGWIAGRFVLLAALVWVPLALRLVEAERPAGLSLLIHRLHPPCALLLIGSFLLPASLPAALLTLPWAGWAALIGLRGLLRLWAGREQRLYQLAASDELCLDLGMLALPVGGIWLLAARASLPLMGFVYPITLLTGMHFHYAGLLLPVIVGLAGRLLPAGTNGWALYRVLGPAVCLGVWMVAAGITLGGLAEALAGTVFATLLAAVAAILLLQAAPRITDDPLARALLLLGLLAAWPAMGLAAVYALSRAGLTSISLETMALLHGTLLAVVFVGCSLLGLARVRPAPHDAA
jgi:hypothetical protein